MPAHSVNHNLLNILHTLRPAFDKSSIPVSGKLSKAARTFAVLVVMTRDLSWSEIKEDLVKTFGSPTFIDVELIRKGDLGLNLVLRALAKTELRDEQEEREFGEWAVGLAQATIAAIAANPAVQAPSQPRAHPLPTKPSPRPTAKQTQRGLSFDQLTSGALTPQPSTHQHRSQGRSDAIPSPPSPRPDSRTSNSNHNKSRRSYQDPDGRNNKEIQNQIDSLNRRMEELRSLEEEKKRRVGQTSLKRKIPKQEPSENGEYEWDGKKIKF